MGKIELIDPDEFEKYKERFTERELRLIDNSVSYVVSDPAGLPGHNLMIVIHKLMLALCNDKPSNAS